MVYPQMLIVADENMPFAREWFAPFGTVHTLPGRALTAAQIQAADALLVRSVTRVDRDLLCGSRVRFVGSATSGIEHIDSDYLQAQGVACASAPGCNATAVVEYVLSSLCALDGVLEKLLAGGVVGVIGLGNVGARLVRRLQALGIRCVGYDPFLPADSGLPLCDLATVLAADIICCHTPLTKTGRYPTWHVLDAQRLRQLRRDAVLINASRGAVVDNAALLQLLRTRSDVRAVLDVWEGEPALDLSLLDAVAIATPHIAGYSWEAKVAGTRAVLEAFCNFFQLPLPVHIVGTAKLSVSVAAGANAAALLRSAMQSVYDVRCDDRDMRMALSGRTADEIATAFDRLRKQYPQRREIAACSIANWRELTTVQQTLLLGLGFVPGEEA